MMEMMLLHHGIVKQGLTGAVYGKTQRSITGNGMKISGDGKYLASGYATANGGTGEVYISDLRSLTNPVIKRTIRLPDWKAGTSSGTYTRAGQLVRGSDDLSTIMANSQQDGFDMGAIYVMDLDADHNVTGSTKLIPAGTTGGNYFSLYCDMSRSGNVIVASAIGYNSFVGRVYIYSRSGGTWSLEKTIDRPAGSPTMRFGTPVSISGNGELLAVSGIPGGAAGTSKVFIYKRDGGAWNLVKTIDDNRALSGAGRLSGYFSGDGSKLFVTYSYHNATVGTPSGGVDIYDVNQTTGDVLKIASVPTGIDGGGYGIQPYVNYTGSVFMGAPSLPVGNQFRGMNCVQLNVESGQYETPWNFNTPAVDVYPLYPVVNDQATVWGVACPNLIGLAQDSFWCGR